MAALWNGPISLAVFVPAPLGTPEAASCRARVTEYLRSTIDHFKPLLGAPSHLALTVSLLYARDHAPTVHCELTEASTGFEKSGRDDELWRRQFEGRPYIDIYDGEYPVGAMRQLALDGVRHRIPLAAAAALGL